MAKNITGREKSTKKQEHPNDNNTLLYGRKIRQKKKKRKRNEGEKKRVGRERRKEGEREEAEREREGGVGGGGAAVNGDKKSDKVGLPLAEVVHGCGFVVVGVGHQPGGHLCTRPLSTLRLQVTVKLEWGLMGRSLQRESERLLLDVAAGSLEFAHSVMTSSSDPTFAGVTHLHAMITSLAQMIQPHAATGFTYLIRRTFSATDTKYFNINSNTADVILKESTQYFYTLASRRQEHARVLLARGQALHPQNWQSYTAMAYTVLQSAYMYIVLNDLQLVTTKDMTVLTCVYIKGTWN